MEKFINRYQFQNTGGAYSIDRGEIKSDQEKKPTGGFPNIYECDKNTMKKKREFQSLLDLRKNKISLKDLLDYKKN